LGQHRARWGRGELVPLRTCSRRSVSPAPRRICHWPIPAVPSPRPCHCSTKGLRKCCANCRRPSAQSTRQEGASRRIDRRRFFVCSPFPREQTPKSKRSYLASPALGSVVGGWRDGVSLPEPSFCPWGASSNAASESGESDSMTGFPSWSMARMRIEVGTISILLKPACVRHCWTLCSNDCTPRFTTSRWP